MQYGFMPRLMWAAFAPGFKAALPMITDDDAERTMRAAKARYQSILAKVNEFDRDDRFLVNILSGAMLAAVYIGLSQKPDVDTLGQYYEKAMDTAVMRRFLAHKKYYTVKAQAKLKQSAERSRTRTPNPYSWVYDYTPGPDINSYTATFYTCGLCHLLKSLGVEEITPAMCRYDYVMAEKSNTVFTREYTLASGGPYCDCHYKKRK